LESDTEAEVGVVREVGVFVFDEVGSGAVGFADGLADLQIRGDDLQGFVGGLVGFFLRVVRVHDQGARYHGRHVAVLATTVDVDSGWFECACI